MNTSNHIIEKVFLEVNTSRMETVHFIKNNISQFLIDELFPRLEVLFEEYNLPADIVRFDELKLNLSVKNGKDLRAIKYEIEKQIDRQLKQSIRNTKSYDEFERFGDERDLSIVQGVANGKNLNSIFIFFLENSYLPWYANKEEFQNYLSSKSFLENLQKAAFLSKVKASLSKEENVIDRFVYQLTNEVLIAFILENIPKLESFRKPVLKFSKSLKIAERNLFWKSLILLSIPEREKQTTDSFKVFFYQIKIGNVTFSKQTGFSNIKEFVEFLNQILSKKIVRGAVLERHLNSLLVASKSVVNLDDFPHFKVENKPEFTDGKTLVEVELLTKGKDLVFLEKPLTEIAVQNAGLILLHPFLKTFFIETDIADKNGLIHNNKLEMATQALHFMASGKEEFFEGNMVLEKFIIGLPLKMSIPNHSLLTDKIRNEVFVLLENVIKNWSALKNTSPEGLRQMFIQRNGKLIQKKNGFKLLVERYAQDILLEQLNWNISMIKFPWKKELLFVEW